MIKPYRLFVFDWEGTLGEDTVGQVMKAILQEATRLNLQAVNEREARAFVSLGLAHAISKLFPKLTMHQHEQLLEAVHKALAAGHVDDFLMPGVKDFVAHLHAQGFLLAIATNKGQASLQRVLHASGLNVYFKDYRCAGQVPAKPSPQMLIELMDIFNVSADETLMLGDSIVDMEMAKFAGVDAIAVDFYHSNEVALKMSGALAVFDDYVQVATFLGV